MAAGLGFKDFVTGEVLTAADVDGYLMQGVWVFASAAARDAAVTSPQEGNFAYLKDTNVTTYYTGSAWANLDTTGMTNPMTTTGDTIYSSSGSTPARLGIGSTGNVLTVAGGVPTWAAPAAGGGMTLIQETVAAADASITFGSIPGTYKQLQLIITGLVQSTTGVFGLRFNNSSSSIYTTASWGLDNVSPNQQTFQTDQVWFMGESLIPTAVTGTDPTQTFKLNLTIDNYASTSKFKTFSGQRQYKVSSTNYNSAFLGEFGSTSAITSLDIFRVSGSSTLSNNASTSIRLYGIS